MTLIKKRIGGWNGFTVEPGYNDIVLCDTSPITSDILYYQLIPHCRPQHYTPRL